LRIALYPGSFDPFTNGHLDIAQRAAKLFDKLIVAVYEHPTKNVLFSAEERQEMVRQAVEGVPKIEAASFSGLSVEYARSRNACALVRGLRALSDFDYEFQIALMNRNLSPDLEATFLMTSLPYVFLSSSIVKEIAKLGGPLDGLVPTHVEGALRRRFGAPSGSAAPHPGGGRS